MRTAARGGGDAGEREMSEPAFLNKPVEKHCAGSGKHVCMHVTIDHSISSGGRVGVLVVLGLFDLCDVF